MLEPSDIGLIMTGNLFSGFLMLSLLIIFHSGILTISFTKSKVNPLLKQIEEVKTSEPI